jgi:hypothetical protein
LARWPHAAGSDDAACLAVFVSHDESAHRIDAAPSRDGEGRHCYLCHSARSWFSFFETYAQRGGPVRAERLHAARISSDDRLEWSLVLGRAPPI